MKNRKTTSAIVVALLFGAVAIYFVTTRKNDDSSSTSSASPGSQPAEPVANAPPAPAEAVAQPGAGTTSDQTTESNDPGGRGAAAKQERGAVVPAVAKSPAKKEEPVEKKSDEAPMSQDEAKKQIVEPAPAPTPTGNLAANFQNKAGVTYRLVSVSCTVDGVSACGSARGNSFAMFNRKLDAGSHTLSVVAVYEGAGGPFSYASGYRFTVKNGRNFTVDADRVAHVNVMVHETGGPTTPMEQRLRMAFNTK